MTDNKKIAIAWLRRDLRIEDNRALYEANLTGNEVLVLFIFDTDIIDELDIDDHRITFIHDTLLELNAHFEISGSGLMCLKGKPLDIFKKLNQNYAIESVHAGEDYEPYAITRDYEIAQFLFQENISFNTYKDHVIFEKDEVMKQDQKPYTVFTPYKNRWIEQLKAKPTIFYNLPEPGLNLMVFKHDFPGLDNIGFIRSVKKVLPYDLTDLNNYEKERNIPAWDKTSKLSPHLRFGTVSVRWIISQIRNNSVLLSELIWREFFIQILYHFPEVVAHNFKEKYNGIQWRNNDNDFILWCEGRTGYPMVDAGMRELNATGYMHNRVRMITAGFLCKHLLIDWRWGEAYFAKKLFDYELASNNGNWQWSAGTGCDAAPYFRIFNPMEQLRKFDPDMDYIKKWVPEISTPDYPQPMVDHKEARVRALEVYRKGINNL